MKWHEKDWLSDWRVICAVVTAAFLLMTADQNVRVGASIAAILALLLAGARVIKTKGWLSISVCAVATATLLFLGHWSVLVVLSVGLAIPLLIMGAMYLFAKAWLKRDGRNDERP